MVINICILKQPVCQIKNKHFDIYEYFSKNKG
jgi:hypothetical protein